MTLLWRNEYGCHKNEKAAHYKAALSTNPIIAYHCDESFFVPSYSVSHQEM